MKARDRIATALASSGSPVREILLEIQLDLLSPALEEALSHLPTTATRLTEEMDLHLPYACNLLSELHRSGLATRRVTRDGYLYEAVR